MQSIKYILSNFLLIIKANVLAKLMFRIYKKFWAISHILNLATNLLR